MTTYTLEGGNVDYANDWQLPNGTNSTVVPGAGDTVIFPDGSGPFGSLNVSEVEIQGDVTLSALTLTSGSSTISDNPLGGGNGGTFNMISGSSWTVNGTLTETDSGTKPIFASDISDSSQLMVSGTAMLPDLSLQIGAGTQVSFGAAVTLGGLSDSGGMFTSGELTGGGFAENNAVVHTGDVDGGIELQTGASWTAGDVEGSVDVGDDTDGANMTASDILGNVTVAGAGDTLDVSGTVDAPSLFIGPNTGAGVSVLKVGGDLTSDYVRIGSLQSITSGVDVAGDFDLGSTSVGGGTVGGLLSVVGTLALGVTFSSDVTLDVTGTIDAAALIVGKAGDAEIDDNGGIIASSVTLGADEGATGTLNIGGEYADPIDVPGDFVVGDAGDGVLTITAGAKVQVGGDFIVGAQTSDLSSGDSVSISSLGTATGSALTVTGYVDVGGENSGSLSLTGSVGVGGGSATLTDASGVVGDNSGSVGSASVTGPGAVWTNTESLLVGNDGTGLLSVAAGGLVNVGGALSLGGFSKSSADVTVTGQGSGMIAPSLGVGGTTAKAGGSAVLTIDAGGVVSVSGAAAIWNAGTVDLDNGTLDANTLTLSMSANLVGYGELVAGGLNAAITDSGSITASGGALNVTGPVVGAGTLAIASGAKLYVETSAAPSLTAAFLSDTGVLGVADPAAMQATITGFAGKDAIDLVDIAATGASLVGDSIVVDNQGVQIANFAEAGLDATTTFQVMSDGGGGSLVMISEPAGTPSPPSQPLVTKVPASLADSAGTTVAIPGVSVSDPNADPTTTLTVTLSDTDGQLIGNATGGGLVTTTKNGLSLTISGTVAQVNADLATLSYTGNAAGSDTISVNSSDSLGNADAHKIPVAVAAASGPTSDTIKGADGNVRTISFGNPALASLAAPLLAGITPANALFVDSAGVAAMSASQTAAVDDAAGAVSITGNAAANETVAAGAGALNFTAGTGNGTVVAGSGNDFVFLPDGGNWLTALGNGADTVVAASGNDTVETGAAGSFVFLGAGASSVASTGADTILGGTGSSTVAATGANNAEVFSLGAPLQFIAGTGASTVVAGAVAATIIGGASGGSLVFTDGATQYVGADATDTVVGLAGSLTVQGGAGGGLFFGGTAGNNIITAGAGNVTAFGAGAGDVLTATGSASDLFAGGVGAETLSGAGSTGQNTFFAGFGPETLVGGAGNTALVAGAGPDLLAAGNGLTLFLFVDGRTAAAADTISGFNPAQDFVKLAGYSASEASVVSNATVVNGSAVISLSDNTTITFAGVVQLNLASFN